MDQSEPLWREDISAQRDTLEALWKTQFMFVTRLEAQDAPPALVERMVFANNNMHLAHEALSEVMPYFAPEPPYGKL